MFDVEIFRIVEYGDFICILMFPLGPGYIGREVPIRRDGNCIEWDWGVGHDGGAHSGGHDDVGMT